MDINLVILEGLFILTSPVLSQYSYNEIKPDVTFGDHNERFDVSDLMSHQNRYFRSDGSIDYRRSHGSKRGHKFLRTNWNPQDKTWDLGSQKIRTKFAQKMRKETGEQLNKLANIILLKMKYMRRTPEDDFAFHDNMESDGGDVYDFNKNLEKFVKRSQRSGDQAQRADEPDQSMAYRRIGQTADVFNYAFPIEMQVKGYLLPSDT